MKKGRVTQICECIELKEGERAGAGDKLCSHILFQSVAPRKQAFKFVLFLLLYFTPVSLAYFVRVVTFDFVTTKTIYLSTLWTLSRF